MGKFSGAAALSNEKLRDISHLAQPDVPVEQTPAPTQQPSPPPGGLMAELVNNPPPPELQEQVDAGIEAGIAEEAAVSEEINRQAIPSLAERGKSDSVQRWLRPTTTKSTASQSPDGNIRSRAKAMADTMAQGDMFINLNLPSSNPGRAVEKEGGSPQQVAEAIAQEQEGSLVAAVNRSGQVDVNAQGKKVPSRQYVQIASAVTENSIADMSFGTDADFEIDPIQQTLEGEEGLPTKREPDEAIRFSKAQGNEKLGQQIHQEVQRMQGTKTPEKLPQKEAAVLGDAFKELWAKNNPTLVNRFVDPSTQQVYYQLTSAGQSNLEAGATDRKRLFPKTNVRPAKIPLKSGQLPGDIGQNVVKDASGKVGKVGFGKVMQEARRNLAQVPNVVDKQRAKILYSTILPVLQSGNHDSWQAEINNFGPSKIQKYAAAKAGQERRRVEAELEGKQFKEEPYSPEDTLAALTDKIAQEVRAVASERNGANYLTYSIQAFNGRMAPQQTYFDPTTSKAVRFVTRNATPAQAKPGSRVEKNLRQMYAMMLVKGADSKLPPGREVALKGAEAQLEAWGDRLTDALAMTDDQYEAISNAIAEGLPLDDPNFPPIPELALDPDQDAELIQAIEGKGEDGPHFIDGLMDFSKYIKAKRQGKSYPSYFNAYIDGKTNGIASNGIQMGHLGTAAATGVVRKNVKELLDDGDIRDQLKKNAVESIRDGWDGNVEGYESELNDVAEQVFSYRPLNKATTMTFGYGKEVDSFKKDISETIDLLSQTAQKEGGKGLDQDPTSWSKEQKNDYMQWQKARLKAESTYPGFEAEVLFHSSPQANLEADSFRYRPVNVPNKGASGKGAGIFTHGYDTDGSKFGGNVFAVIYDKKKPTYAGKEDTSATAIDEIFIPQQAVEELTRIWPPGPDVVAKFKEERGASSDGLTEGDSFNQSLAVLDEKMTRDELSKTLLNKYEGALRNALSDDALDSRQLMRGAAMLHSATNSLFSIKSYTGMDLNLGRNVSTGADGATESRYRLYGEGGEVARPQVLHYDTEATSAAARKQTDEDGNVEEIAGEYAYGGSLPGPVQSLDAATVAMSVAGNSWKRMKAASGGNPYMHTIYDAFKLDANGYDVGLEEINKNWLDASMNWSYLEQTYDATKKVMQEFNEKTRGRDGEKLTPNERLYIDWALQMKPSGKGTPYLKNFFNKMNKVMPIKGDKDSQMKHMWEMQQELQTEMGKVGWDVNNPPEVATVVQLKTFVRFLNAKLNVGDRFRGMIEKTNNNKKQLRREIQKRGPVLQYYAH